METVREWTIEEIIKIASESGIDKYKKLEEHRHEQNCKKARENTKRLLNGYNELKEHCEHAIASVENSVPSDLQIVLNEVFNRRGLLRVEAIASSKRRTELIIEHIDRMLVSYSEYCANNGKHYCECVIDRYINDITIGEIAEKHNTVERNIYRWLEKGIDDLSIYLFGAYAL